MMTYAAPTQKGETVRGLSKDGDTVSAHDGRVNKLSMTTYASRWMEGYSRETQSSISGRKFRRPELQQEMTNYNKGFSLDLLVMVD